MQSGCSQGAVGQVTSQSSRAESSRVEPSRVVPSRVESSRIVRRKRADDDGAARPADLDHNRRRASTGLLPPSSFLLPILGRRTLITIDGEPPPASCPCTAALVISDDEDPRGGSRKQMTRTVSSPTAPAREAMWVARTSRLRSVQPGLVGSLSTAWGRGGRR